MLMFTGDIQNKVSEIFDCWFGLKESMEKVKYQYRPYDKIKRVRLRAVNFFKSQLKDDFIYVNHDPNKARVSQREDGVFVVTVPVIARALKSVDAPGMTSTSVYIGTARRNRYLTERVYSQNVDLSKAWNEVQEDIANAERWLKEILEVKLTFGPYGGTPFELHFDVVTFEKA